MLQEAAAGVAARRGCAWKNAALRVTIPHMWRGPEAAETRTTPGGLQADAVVSAPCAWWTIVEWVGWGGSHELQEALWASLRG